MGSTFEQLRRLDDAVRQMLKDDLPVQCDAIRHALAGDRLMEAAEFAHSVRGAASFCRLEMLKQAAEALENSLANNEKNAEHIRAFNENANAVIQLLETEE